MVRPSTSMSILVSFLIVLFSTAGAAQSATFTPSSLSFNNQAILTTSSPKTLALTNGGTAALNISGVSMTGDFAQTNNCPASLPAKRKMQLSGHVRPHSNGDAFG